MRVRALLYYRWLVRLAVPNGTPGVYVLGELDDRAHFRPRYVGRSDTNLRNRLADHELRGVMPYFRHWVCATATQAYRRECEHWHVLRDGGLVNRIHPDAPAGTSLLCPYCAAAAQVTASCRS